MITTRRVYEKAPRTGPQFLVERLWPRGIRKEQLKIDGWLRDVAPTTELRKWFSHDPAKWAEFRRRYFTELDRKPEVWQPLIDAARHGDVTLLYSSHDTEHNNAVALKTYLEQHLGGSHRRRTATGSASRRQRARTGTVRHTAARRAAH